MDIGHLTERLMGMDDRAWARHANPWSGWTRMPTLPLMTLVLWYRDALGAMTWVLLAGLVLWVWVNPRLFSEPVTLDNWMSKAVLGERVWLARKTAPIPRHHAEMALGLNISSAAGALLLAYGLWLLDGTSVWVGLIVCVGAKMWFLDRMVWLLADTRSPGNSPSADP